MILFEKLSRNKTIIVSLVLLFLLSFVIPAAVLAEGKIKKQNTIVMPISRWSSEKLLVKENDNTRDVFLSFSSAPLIPLNLKKNGLTANTLFQKPPEPPVPIPGKNGPNYTKWYIIGGGAVALGVLIYLLTRDGKKTIVTIEKIELPE